MDLSECSSCNQLQLEQPIAIVFLNSPAKNSGVDSLHWHSNLPNLNIFFFFSQPFKFLPSVYPGKLNFHFKTQSRTTLVQFQELQLLQDF